MKLSPSVAGVTLLAIGNGAPDVFTATAALNNYDWALALSMLFGSSIFIMTVVLGSVLMVSPQSKKGEKSIKASDFFRDIITFCLLFATVIMFCYNGRVSLWETLLIIGLYCCYIAYAVIATRRVFQRSNLSLIGENTALLSENETSVQLKNAQAHTMDEPLDIDLLDWDSDIVELDSIFPGLRYPYEARWWKKMQYVLEWPFSVLRWISIPCADMVWGPCRRRIALICPPFSLLLYLLAFGGRSTFQISMGPLLLPVWLSIMGVVLSIYIYFSTAPIYQSPKIYPILAVFGFLATMAWLSIQAIEMVKNS